MSVREVNTARIQSLKGHSFDGGSTSQKFTDTDSAPVAGVTSSGTYEYSIVVDGDTTALYKVKLVGKVGSETTVRTAEIEVFHDEVEQKLLTNIRTDDMRFEAFRSYVSPSTTFTLRITNDFSGTFYFSIYTEGLLYNAAQTGFSGAGFLQLGGSRGIWSGGMSGTERNRIDYITITTLSDATDFGNLTESKRIVGGLSDSSKGIVGGGKPSSTSDVMDYVTIATPMNAIDFGNLTLAKLGLKGTSDGSRGIFFGGEDAPGTKRIEIDYITISSSPQHNASDFGDLSLARRYMAAVSSTTRGICAGGDTGSSTDRIDYITIASTGTAIDFGNLSVARNALAGCSDGSRGVFIAGQVSVRMNVMDYITIAIPSATATDFGDLNQIRYGSDGTSDGSRGVIGDGYGITREGGAEALVADIDFITIATPMNALPFGNLILASEQQCAYSGD